MNMSEHSTKPRVVIAGGGIAGLEAALALADLGGDRAQLTLVSAEPDFVYRPLTVEEPFTHQPAERHELEPALGELGVEFIRGAVSSVDPAAHTLTLDGNSSLAYDLLVMCIGGRARPAYEGVETLASLWSGRGDVPIDDLIRTADESPSKTLALVVPPTTSWALPLYELALMIRRRSEDLGVGDVHLRVVTPEPAPLGVFGSTASAAVADLLGTRHISVDTNSRVVQDAAGALRVLVKHSPPLEAGAVLALPEIEGPAIAGLPADAHGFIPTDPHGRVEGVDDVYAAGDGTTFPVKQGGLATQQADAAAEHIAARLGAEIEPQPFDPVLRGQLLTGADSLHMRHGLSGGQGEGVASADYLWWPPQKVGGRYLSAWLGHTAPGDLEPPSLPLEVEVAWPHDWHGEPLSYDAERALEQ
jgi:sulfide:quinone oxidoreductase